MDCCCVYGYFHGGDPRRFYPDAESNTRTEIDEWAVAYDAWDARERGGISSVPENGGCVTMFGPRRSGFGLGTNRCLACYERARGAALLGGPGDIARVHSDRLALRAARVTR